MDHVDEIAEHYKYNQFAMDDTLKQTKVTYSAIQQQMQYILSRKRNVSALRQKQIDEEELVQQFCSQSAAQGFDKIFKPRFQNGEMAMYCDHSQKVR